MVIVGAGFGGLAAARSFDGAPVDVTLVDRNNFHTFQPLLYQVATSGLTPGDVAHPVRGIFHGQDNVTFRLATVTGGHPLQSTITLQEQVDDGPRLTELRYDHLIVAAGATTNTFDIPGVDRYGFPLYALADAVRLRNHVLERFEAADADPALLDDGALTFLVVGGGPTGVEVAGALAELIGAVLRHDFPRLAVERARVVLVEMQDDLLTPFRPPSRRHARRSLEGLGVEVRTGQTVERVERTCVTLAGGEVVPAHTLVWAAGVRANPLAAALGLPTARGGRIEVHPDLSVVGRPGVWAIGDVAATPDVKAEAKSRDGALLPQLAPVAIQSGRHVGAQVLARLDGRATTAFRYLDKGTMATIGRRRAVAELPLRIRLWGTPAWLAWLGLHLVFLVGFRNRITVFVNWAWNYLTWDRGPRLILVAEDPTPPEPSDPTRMLPP